jgi:hypothetical protein
MTHSHSLHLPTICKWSSRKDNEKFGNSFANILFEFLQILNQKGISLNKGNIKKVYNLNVYGKREIIRDWLVFLYYHSLDANSHKKAEHDRLYIKPKELSKREKEILKKYDNKLPIVDSQTIANYLPDVLLLAEIPPCSEYYRERSFSPIYRQNKTSLIDISKRLGECNNLDTLLKYVNSNFR